MSISAIDVQTRIVLNRAIEVFADESVANDWMQTPNHLLNGESPLQAIDHGRAAEVDEILTRIDYGIFS